MRHSDVERHRYGPGRSQFAELRLPGRPGPHPVAVLLHGGFWRSTYGRGLMDGLAADLAARGWAAWNLEYRRVGPFGVGGGGWPGTFEDVAAGIDALAGPAGAAGLDLGRVVTVGHSAGGHLALWAAARPGLPDGAPGARPAIAVTGAVALAGVCDLAAAARDRLGGSAVPALLGGRPERVPERYALASPAERLPLGVPQVLVHGGADRIVPVGQSRRYAAAARAAGDACELVELRGVDHFAVIDPRSPAWLAAVERLP
jgi:acetyl esterase/lipase